MLVEEAVAVAVATSVPLAVTVLEVEPMKRYHDGS
jgi:hypothetical protein